jgi:hypothetical protein
MPHLPTGQIELLADDRPGDLVLPADWDDGVPTLTDEELAQRERYAPNDE